MRQYRFLLPASTTSLIQPQDQGIIASVKKRYKSTVLKRFLSSYSANLSDPNPLLTFYQKFTIKDVIFILADIWATTPKATLRNAWKNLNINVDEGAVDEVIDFPYQMLFTNTDMTAWLNTDIDSPGWPTLSNSEIVRELQNVAEPEIDLAEPEIEEQLQEDTMSTNEALEAVLKLNKWLGLQQNSAEQQKATFQVEKFIRDKHFTNYSKLSKISLF